MQRLSGRTIRTVLRRCSSTVVRLNRRVISASDLLQDRHEHSTIDAPSMPSTSTLGLKKETGKPKKIIDLYSDFQHQFPGHYILMQVGDFFELYGESAVEASRILDIGLTTAPNKISGNGSPVAMTGVPVRSVETYVERFIKAGHSVVLCEQIGQAVKSVRMERRATRIITPGTVTEESLLESGVNNFLCAVVPDGDQCGLAWIDISTGYFRLASCPTDKLQDELARLNPREILLSSIDRNDHGVISLIERMRICCHKLSPTEFSTKKTGEVYEQIFGQPDSPFDQSLLAPFDNLQLQASVQVLEYILRTQLDKRPYIEMPSMDDPKLVMRIDAASFRSLEILSGNNSDSNASLLGTINETLTAAGSRLLSRWLQRPSTDLKLIQNRHDLVDELLANPELHTQIRGLLQSCKDLERCYQRLALNRTSGGPRDMQLILSTLNDVTNIRLTLLEYLNSKNDSVLNSLSSGLVSFDELINTLSAALNDKLPYRVSDGGVIREGYSTRLDSLRLCSGDVRKAKSLLENKYRLATGKTTLKIEEGKLLGFYAEVSRSEGMIPADTVLFHFDGQTESKYRYRTSELNDLKDSNTVNEAKILAEESLIYESLRQKIVKQGAEIIQAAKTVAELDVLCSFAHSAKQNNYVRPVVTSSATSFEIRSGRHPVVEKIQSDAGRLFTRNDCNLGAKPFALITGVNMGGKSTFLRQNALVAVMAQCGSFVPADSAHIGLLDAVYTRIGASDDLAKDRSTFMLEMMETASILANATDRSLVIMDEIGRGTAAEEGFALAWAIVDHLINKIKCRTLFATHYYGLAGLAQSHSDWTQCLQTTANSDSDGNVTFMHKLVPGVASHSFAIEIGRFAGLPTSVLTMARVKLEELRNKESELVEDHGDPTPLIETLKEIDVDEMSPREAHATLYRLTKAFRQPALV